MRLMKSQGESGDESEDGMKNNAEVVFANTAFETIPFTVIVYVHACWYR